MDFGEEKQLVEIIRASDGKSIEIDCPWFADENIPWNIAKELCFNPNGKPKCRIFMDCYSIYTSRF